MDLQTIAAKSYPPKSHETEGENSHWIYESFHLAPRELYEGTECMITVVLDGGLASDYCGIRLLIVCNQSQLAGEDLDHFQRIYDLRPFGITTADAMDETIPQTGGRRSDAPICSVVLELYDSFIGSDKWADHFKLRAIEVSDLSDRAQDWRIVYDTLHTFKSDLGSALVQFLYFNRSFLVRTVYDPFTYKERGLFVWSYRVLPTSHMNRRALANLPSSVIKSIARQGVETKNIDWPQQIIRLTAISRDWRIASDMLLEFSDSIDMKYFIGLSRFLELFPTKAGRIRKLNIEFHPSLGENQAKLKRLVDASISVINLTTNLHSLELTWSGEEIDAILPAVGRLRFLEYAELIGMRPYEGPFQCPFSLIQSLVPESMNSLHLRVMMPELYSDKTNASEGKQFKAFPERSPWDVDLLTLKLSNIMLTSLQMSQCIPSKSTSLTEVYFRSVFGVANQDLLAFLSAISHSLRCLYVVECEFPTQQEDEEWAIDATMQSMVSLEYAELSPCVATTLSILRKPALANALDPEASPLCGVFINPCHNKSRRISQCKDLNDIRFQKGMAMIVPAFEATGWTVIGFGMRDPENLPQEARDVAKARGIDLADYSDWWDLTRRVGRKYDILRSMM